MKFGLRGNTKVTVFSLALLLLLALVAGCTDFDNKQTPLENQPNIPQAQNETGETVPPSQEISVAVYYFKMTSDDAYLVREVHQVPYTKEVVKAALEELINTDPVTPGASRLLPPATKIRGITIRDGLATVDFSREVLLANVGASGEVCGIQSIVNTITEIPGIQKVSFMVEGKVDEQALNWWGHVGLYQQPFTRDISKVYEPVIWVTSPHPGQKIASPLEIRGTARVFEATVAARLVDAQGKEIAKGFATASEGAPGRGEFTLPLNFQAASPGSGKVEVFWGSPKDGTELDKVVIPISW
ncbi:MAG: Gmad2 immunoglobulin-like domain-containing protein [Desulfotomaculaceae bacterium]|nr:Gmad2 immunoglobulin-like domain-containing protein [Desulfotomaculaceae bacterium]